MTRAERLRIEAIRTERGKRSTVDDELCKVLFIGAVVMVVLTVIARVVWL